MEVPYEDDVPGGYVNIILPWSMFEHHFSESFLLTADTRFRNAVHVGVGYLEGPLPSGGIGVTILHFSVEPSSFVTDITDETHRMEIIAGVIEGLILGTVAAMYSAVNQLEVI